jgi:4-aminobutyrate aminotransferase/4-aminobutyrate aminotransferase/(S)-3-amino-2-methylpropionate transaminase
MKGLSSQVKLFPVCFEEGSGITLTDVDGNKYLDFSSGIYVTSLGHCHPKISEAVSYWAKKLMNAHDFTTPVKEKLMEKMAGILPGKLNAIQLYSDGTASVEAALRAARAITNKHEIIRRGKLCTNVPWRNLQLRTYPCRRLLHGSPT